MHKAKEKKSVSKSKERKASVEPQSSNLRKTKSREYVSPLSDETGMNVQKSKDLQKSKSISDKDKKRYKSSRRSRSHSSCRSDTAVTREDDDHSAEGCRCLGVFGLSSYTEERELRDVFGAYGDIDKLCLIYDKLSGHSKGYGFVYFKSTADAIKAKRDLNGMVLDDRDIRVDYSITSGPHSPTPGIYRGRHRYRPTAGYRSSRYHDRHSHRDKYTHRHADYYSYRRDRTSRDDSYKRNSSRRYSPQPGYSYH